MSSRKILVLLSDSPVEARQILSFVFQLLQNSHGLVAAAFPEEENIKLRLQQRIQLVSELEQEFGSHPEIRFVLRSVYGLTPEEIEREAKYTDLIVLSDKMLTSREQKLSVQLTAGVESNIGVPILVMPKGVRSAEDILITYDGLPQGIAPIKQFCQIMGDLCQNTRVTLIEYNHDSAAFQPEEEKLLIEYLKQHCHSLGIYKVSNESPHQILQLINSSNNAIVVSGTSRLLNLPGIVNAPLDNPFLREEKLPGFFGAV